MKYNKLVRDKIPDLIKAKGETAVTHTASEEEFRKKLIEKLGEEAQEFIEDPSAGELADILEVIDALTALPDFPIDTVREAKEKKRNERGGFTKKIILDES